MEKNIESLIKKASSAEKSDDAMRFSQAACNAANALNVLKVLGHLAEKGSYPQ